MFVEPKGKGNFNEVRVVLLKVHLPLNNFIMETMNLFFPSVLRLLTDITTKSKIQRLKEDLSLLCVEGR